MLNRYREKLVRFRLSFCFIFSIHITLEVQDLNIKTFLPYVCLHGIEKCLIFETVNQLMTA